MENSEEIQNSIYKIRKNILTLSEDMFILQNNMKQSGAVFNNRVFTEHKEKSINRLGRILNYAQKIVNVYNVKG